MNIAVLGIDLGKNVCSVVGLDPSGAVVLRRRVRRDTLIDLVAKLPSCIVGMEACCGAHHLGRPFAGQGHDIRLMSPDQNVAVVAFANKLARICWAVLRSGQKFAAKEAPLAA